MYFYNSLKYISHSRCVEIQSLKEIYPTVRIPLKHCNETNSEVLNPLWNWKGVSAKSTRFSSFRNRRFDDSRNCIAFHTSVFFPQSHYFLLDSPGFYKTACKHSSTHVFELEARWKDIDFKASFWCENCLEQPFPLITVLPACWKMTFPELLNHIKT